MTSYADYLFLLSPPEVIKHEISRYKKASVKHIGEFASMNSPAHISINQIERQKPFMADAAFERIERIVSGMPPVLLHLDSFKYFTHLHSKYTIYACVRTTPAVDAWFTQLRLNINMRKALVPHITVVRNIPEADFNKLWPHFRHKKLTEAFWIADLRILHRETFGTTSTKWEPFKTIQFKGMRRLEREMESKFL